MGTMPSMAIGVSVVEGSQPGGRDPLVALDAWSSLYGRPPATFSVWSSWATSGSGIRGKDFQSSIHDGLLARGVTPLVFWEPMLPANDGHNNRIVNGEWDDYLLAWGAAAKAWGNPLIVRFAHEQNAGWFPWGTGVNGNTPATYIAMWRHVVGIVRNTAQAMNVRFLWCPNGGSQGLQSGGTRTMQETYPGSAWCQMVGMDSYGWKPTSPPLHVARSAELAYLLRLGKSVVIAESAVTSEGGITSGQRETWLRQSLSGVQSLGVGAFVYFDIDMSVLNGQPDWALTARPGVGWVMRDMLGRPKFQGVL